MDIASNLGLRWGWQGQGHSLQAGLQRAAELPGTGWSCRAT